MINLFRIAHRWDRCDNAIGHQNLAFHFGTCGAPGKGAALRFHINQTWAVTIGDKPPTLLNFSRSARRALQGQ